MLIRSLIKRRASFQYMVAKSLFSVGQGHHTAVKVEPEIEG